jgi:CRP-like cAMP-binding protein
MNSATEYLTRVSSDLIKNSALGEEMTDDQCAVLGKIITVRGLKENDFLFREGDRDGNLYVIIKGSLEALRTTGAGDLVSLYVLREGEIAGVMGFLDGLGHSADLRAIHDCEVLSVQRDNFEKMARERPEIGYRVMRAIIRNVHAILRRMNVQFVELTNYISKQHGRY